MTAVSFRSPSTYAPFCSRASSRSKTSTLPSGKLPPFVMAGGAPAGRGWGGGEAGGGGGARGGGGGGGGEGGGAHPPPPGAAPPPRRRPPASSPPPRACPLGGNGEETSPPVTSNRISRLHARRH